MFKKLKENNKKGFTLVELIVVLVILAILAALLIPALTGYIDKAKNKSIVAETRQTVMAAQTLADEEYAKASEGADITLVKAEIAKLAEVTEANIKDVKVTAGKVESLVYEKNGKTCTYKATVTAADKFSDGNYNVTKTASGTTGQS